MSKCNMYYRSDMGWEPVWHGLWINKVELEENLPKQFKLKGAILKMTMTFPYNTTKMRQNPFWLSPIFAIFQAPHIRLYA